MFPIFTSGKEVIFTMVSISLLLLVGLSAGVHKLYRMDFRGTIMEDGSQPKIDTIKFW